MSDNKIVEIATGVMDKYDIYVVKGKAITIKEHVLDLDNSCDVSRILSLSDDLLDHDKFLPAIYGWNTMAVVVSMESRECAVAMGCISDLPDDVAKAVKSVAKRQEKARSEAIKLIKSKNQIVEIATDVLDKYDIYVVNGKPIGIKHHVLNVDNPDHLADIVSIAKDLFCVPDLPAIYKEDTICILAHSGGECCGGEYCRAAIGISDMTGLPDDVVKKVKVAMAEYIKSNNQIAQIATGVSGEYDIYAVKGKAIAIKDHAFDLSDSYDVSRILSLSDDLFDRDKFLPAIYGSDTMAVVIAIGNGEYTVSMTCISGFPDGIQKKLKAAMDEQEKMRLAAVERIKNENQIVQIATDVLDEYDVYVVNGKPIGIKHHVLNVNNPEHLNDIVSTAKELFCVPDLPAIYKEDTICIFVPYDKKYCRSMISISDMGGFPDDVVKKVKSAVDGYARN